LRIALFDFQETALDTLRSKINAARQSTSVKDPQAISFSAPTGAGKTVVMTALFEDIFYGNLDFSQQKDAVILWISDMPELNEQSRLKIESKSDRIRTAQLFNVDSDFDAKVFPGGNVYFMNTQKLGSDKLLTKKGDNRTYPIWETLSNTARAIPDRFYVVIDEAHRGMRGTGAAESRTIMQKFLLGSDRDGLCKMPLVIGISATPRRFEDLLAGTTHTVHKVYVQPEDVRESGLLKDRVLIDFPEQNTNAEITLLGIAADKWQEQQKGWAAYCKAEDEALVDPILVIQVEDANEQNPLTRTPLSKVLANLESRIGRKFRDGEIAHNFNEVGNLDVDGYKLRRIEAARIEETKGIRVVIFKMSLSTGWDCPRAEVLMSFRRAQDTTYIAQLLGRMIRTPLARRIASDESLNDVYLFLPHFDRDTVTEIIEKLQTGEDVPPTEVGPIRELITLVRREDAVAAFHALENLITYRVNKVRKQSSLRRVMTISRRLTHDEFDAKALDRTKKIILDGMQSEIERLRTSGELVVLAEQLTGVSIQRLSAEYGSSSARDEGQYIAQVASADIDRRFQQAGRTFGNGLHMDYWRSQGDRDADEVKIEATVLASDEASMRGLETISDNEFNRLFSKYRPVIRDAKENKRLQYEKLRLASNQLAEIDWVLPDTIEFRRTLDDPKYEKHIYVEQDGSFRANLGPWERGVLALELADPDVIGWLRNEVKKQWSFEIPYRKGGIETPMYPDLIVVRKSRQSYLVDILEPHNPSYNDNHEKAKGLAEFATNHGILFDRIQMIRKIGGKYVRLDFNDETIRRKTLGLATDPQLDNLFETDGAVG
jgi:type III restriction enzyme